MKIVVFIITRIYPIFTFLLKIPIVIWTTNQIVFGLPQNITNLSGNGYKE